VVCRERQYALQATELNSTNANQRLPELLFTEVLPGSSSATARIVT
jgi:hypothetical protein